MLAAGVDHTASPFTFGLHRRVKRRRSSSREPQKRKSTLIAKMNATCVFTKSVRDVNVHWGFDVDIDILRNVCEVRWDDMISKISDEQLLLPLLND